jgi:catalase (peroxidase I)
MLDFLHCWFLVSSGSDGATMRFHPESSDGANAGLEKARFDRLSCLACIFHRSNPSCVSSYSRAFLEPIKKKFDWLSYGDLWTLAGVVSIEDMGGPKIPWSSGRTDNKSEKQGRPVPENGRLPDASKDESHVRTVFYRMGFNDREIVALCGAHSLGRCHTDRSGYEGRTHPSLLSFRSSFVPLLHFILCLFSAWTFTPTKFSNQYFIQLIKNTWTKRKWNGPEQYEDSTGTCLLKHASHLSAFPDPFFYLIPFFFLGSGSLMMLPADLALIQDSKFKKIVEEYAEDKDVFFKDFAKAFGKLLELGVRRPAIKAKL